MQPAARSGLTGNQVIALIRDSDAVTVSAGLELVDLALNVLEDISDEFYGGSVTRSNYATLHGTANLAVTRELDWGTALVRPYMTMTDGVVSARFNLGVYLTSSPRTEATESPITHEVEGYDILHWLNTPTGEAYTVGAGTGFLAAVETILTTQGIQAYWIDQTRADNLLNSPRSWAFNDETTWLNIINDLAGAVGYQGIWSDWDGRLRVEPYQLPRDRATEWTYTDDAATSMLSPKRAMIRDWFDVPNRWVYYWSKDPAEAAPVEGAGIYVYTNQIEGPTSVQARGRVISAKPERVDASDQAALEAIAQQKIDSDMRLKTTYEVETFPNPLHWHFDRMVLADPTLGPIADILGVNWTLPLNGDDMRHEWSAL